MLKPAVLRPMASGPISSPTRGNAGGSHQTAVASLQGKGKQKCPIYLSEDSL